MKLLPIFALALFTGAWINPAAASREEVASVKAEIFALAESFRGQGDPDFSRQDALEPLVQRLLSLSPQPPVAERLPILRGAWEQVWGPYDYRNNDRGVDPEIGVNEISQVVADGYYYNVSPLYENGDRSRERIGLLRGEYTLEADKPNTLRVRFTDYPGVSHRPVGLELWELPALAEADTLENRITIVPSWIVRAFFGGGSLREVYTDEDMRITYGQSAKRPGRESLYIMRRR